MARAAPPHCTHHKTPLFPLFTKFSPFSSPLPILGPRRDGQLLAVYILCINGCPRGVFCHEPNSRGPQWVSPGNRSGACALSAPTNQSLCTLPCLRVLHSVLHSVLRHSSFKATKPNQTKPNQTSQPIFMHSPLFYVWNGTAVSKLSLWPQWLHRSNPWLTKIHFSMS